MIRHQGQSLRLKQVDGLRGDGFGDDPTSGGLFHDQLPGGVVELKQLVDSNSALISRSTTFPASDGFKDVS